MNPYKNLPSQAFWRSAVAQKSMFDIRGLWIPKFDITLNMPIVTFGSCFAQHFGHALRDRGFKWMDCEPAPANLNSVSAKAFNFGLFSCRTGNIYTTSLLLQWLKWALDIEQPPEEYWEKDGRVFDPFRPNVEPNGFASLTEMRATRLATIKALRQAIGRAHLFVFTMGLTESWFNAEHGYEYPMCPGTIAGEFSAEKHEFKAQSFEFIKRNLEEALALLKQANPALKVLLTVSPVPLTATNSGNHVLVATSLSKSTLRAVAGAVVAEQSFVDYFPSFEIINSPVYKGAFFEPNLRQVNPAGVEFVMKNFFHDLQVKFGKYDEAEPKAEDVEESDGSQALCEEELLAAFSRTERTP